MTKTLNKLTHLLFYATSLLIMVIVLTMPISAGEKSVHTFAWICLVLLYAYFFDENPPKFLRVECLYGTAKEEYNREYTDRLLSLSQYGLSLMRKIQINESHRVVNRSIEELKRCHKELKKLSPPEAYNQKHQAILNDVEEFLDSLEDGDYNLVLS